MQINNPNGASIIIDQIYVNRNRVDYTIYEYGTSVTLTRKSHAFSTITLEDSLSTETNYETLCYNTLAAEIDPAYVISSDAKNWVIDLGSTGDSTTIRVYIPSTILNAVLHSGNALDLLLKAMEPLAPQVIRLVNGSHQYLIELEDIHRTILEAYPEIIIEDRV